MIGAVNYSMIEVVKFSVDEYSRFGKATVGDVDEPLGGRHIMPVPISVSGPGKTSPGRSVGAGAN